MAIRSIIVAKLCNNAHRLVLSLSCLTLSACISLPDLNPFGPETNQQTDTQSNSNSNSPQTATRDSLTQGKSARPTLKSLKLEPVIKQDVDIPVLTLAQKRDEYQALLPLIQDPIQKQQVAFRLADIKILIAEQAQQDGIQASPQENVYASAIQDYETVLSEHPIIKPTPGNTLSPEQSALNRKQMDAMYQLSRALDLSAQSDRSVEVAQRFLRTFEAQAFGVSAYHIELYFRIGEYYFSRQQYQTASEFYQLVLNENLNEGGSQKANFYAISAYMQGWSYFKLDNYPQAMTAFAQMLDVSLASKSGVSLTEIESLPLQAQDVPKGELRLVKDSVRIMALTFSYQGNAQAIQSFFARYGSRPYEHLIYDELAQQHLDNDRFQDSANVLESFALTQAMHPRAIEFFIRHIDAFVLGGFPERVLRGKERFVQQYSLGQGLVVNMNTPLGRTAAPYLRDYIEQLAQTEHSIAQNIEHLLNSRLTASSNNNELQATSSGFTSKQTAIQMSAEQQSVWDTASNQELRLLSQQAYRKAADYYKNYIRTFVPAPQAYVMRFYLAEALLALNEYASAIAAFETYAYQDPKTDFPPNAPNAVEAAYAALLIYQQQADNAGLSGTALADIESAIQAANDDEQDRAISAYSIPLNARQQSQAQFANTFQQDKRAPTVAMNLMQALFANNNYLPAQDWASYLLAYTSTQQARNASNLNARKNTDLENMTRSAMLVTAHSYFEMNRYKEAEGAYRTLLAKLSTQDALNTDLISNLSDRLAASLYRQAEQVLASAQLDTKSLQAANITNKAELSPLQLDALMQGLNLLQTVLSDVPQSEFTLAAHYDSAVYFLLLEDWSKAIVSFSDFKQRYPQNPLSEGIDDQLFYAYQQTENWAKAAPILLAKHRLSPTTENGRIALYQAAEYFDKANNRSQALDSFRQYAHQYPSPFADANEARFILSEYYKQSGEDQKRRFWLNKLVASQTQILKTSPEQSTARSVYLASMSAMVFANDADIAFTRIKLKQPLAESLQRKQTALNRAIAEYEKVVSFGSAQYTTAANFKLAELYTTLSADLINSARPDNLSALELSQYEILLEEQAYPFEETAIDLHVRNAQRSSAGIYDTWVQSSFEALSKSMPARYRKPEVIEEINADDF